MDERRKTILLKVISEHIDTKLPVGSSALVKKYNLDISPATVRNIMSQLEEEGYIHQPYTSAGRIPTEKAYRLYIETIFPLEEKNIYKEIGNKDLGVLDESLKNFDEAAFKEAAKSLAEISGNAVFWAFNHNNLYYTGISNLLQQPEFYHTGSILNVSTVIDRMDEIINDIFEKLNTETQVLIGSENPFGGFCSTVLAKYKIGGRIGLFGVLGPLRMNYKRNLSAVEYIFKKINK